MYPMNRAIHPSNNWDLMHTVLTQKYLKFPLKRCSSMSKHLNKYLKVVCTKLTRRGLSRAEQLFNAPLFGACQFFSLFLIFFFIHDCQKKSVV